MAADAGTMPAAAQAFPTRIAVWFGLLLAAFAVGFLAFGEFGGWEYGGGGGHYESVYNYDTDDYDMVWRGGGSATWDSDGLFTEPVLIFPILLAIACLTGAMVLLGRAARDPAAVGRATYVRAGALAGGAAATIAVAAILYAGSMGEVSDWWFGSAFWAGLVNSVVLAAVALFLASRAPPALARPSAT